MGTLPTPEQAAKMHIGMCLGNILKAAKAEARMREMSVSEVILANPTWYGTFLSRTDLEYLSRRLGVSIYGESEQLEDVFAFVGESLEAEGYLAHLKDEAPELAFELDRRTPRIRFVATD